jgi:spore coat polysaccharide biosynthesis protein SpsF
MSSGKVIIVIQARMSSTRLPGKVMLDLCRKPLLLRMHERVKYSEFADNIVIAASVSKADDEIAGLCEQNEINYFRGSEEDLIERHFFAGEEFGAESIVKIPSDCPLIDYRIIDKILKFYKNNPGKYDYISNLHPATYPDGNDVEVIPMKSLETAYKESALQMEREHTTPFLWERPERFNLFNIEWETGLDYSMSHRFTIDYKEDYDFIRTVYNELYPVNPKFGLNDILSLLESKPEIRKINEKYCGVNWYRNHLHELKTITKNQTKL